MQTMQKMQEIDEIMNTDDLPDEDGIKDENLPGPSFIKMMCLISMAMSVGIIAWIAVIKPTGDLLIFSFIACIAPACICVGVLVILNMIAGKKIKDLEYEIKEIKNYDK